MTVLKVSYLSPGARLRMQHEPVLGGNDVLCEEKAAVDECGRVNHPGQVS